MDFKPIQLPIIKKSLRELLPEALGLRRVKKGRDRSLKRKIKKTKRKRRKKGTKLMKWTRKS